MNQRRVIKIGGSLLGLPDLRVRLQGWIKAAEPRQNILVMGGGNFCNELRTLHQRFHLTAKQSHDLGLELMSVTAKLAGFLWELPVTSQLESIPKSSNDLVLDAQAWIRSLEGVPESWKLTSDSVSALAARELDAELCLMKSVDSNDAVDDYFPTASSGLKKIEFVNLRSR